MMMVFVLAPSAQADPAFHCEASPLRATLAGTQTVEPVTQGRAGVCATGETVPSVALPALLDASVLTARTTYDAAAGRGTAQGGVADLRVLPTPDLISRLPTEQAIDALPNQTVTLPGPLAAALGLLGLPSTLTLDIRDAVRALVPTPGSALLSARLLQADAGIQCTAGAPSLSGSSSVVGVKLLGQDVGVDGVLNQALPLINTQSIALSQLDVSKIHILTPLDGITGPLLAQVQAALVPLLSALPPISLPASVLDVRLTPNEQIVSGSSLTQRALHASISLLGQPVLDAVVGEANVSGDGACPTAPVTGQSVAAAPRPAAAAGVAGQSVADQLLACSDRKLVLVDVLKQGDHVKLLGAANRDYVGKRVAIRLRRGNKIVAHALVRKDGSFETTAPLPPRAIMASHIKSNTLRYRAEIGKELSLPLKLQRRLIVTSLTSKDGKVTISGRVVRPLTTPVSDIRLVRRVSCHKVVLVKRFKPDADGTFKVTVAAPKGQAAAVYRMATNVREKPSNPRSYPTFTLPRGVALNAR